MSGEMNDDDDDDDDSRASLPEGVEGKMNKDQIYEAADELASLKAYNAEEQWKFEDLRNQIATILLRHERAAKLSGRDCSGREEK